MADAGAANVEAEASVHEQAADPAGVRAPLVNDEENFTDHDGALI